jgi:hypothetical protein
METDGRYFAWIRSVTPWVPPKLYPQLIVDAEMVEYLINHQNQQAKLDVVAKHVLTIDQYDMTIDELVEKYPAPGG